MTEPEGGRSGGGETPHDDELFELFEPRRPDAGAFREGVAARIREIENQQDETNATGRGSAWSRAASLLPLDPGSLSAGGAAGGSLLAKAAGATWLSMAFLLPAAITATVFGAFALGARALREATDAGTSNPRAPMPSSLAAEQSAEDALRLAKEAGLVGLAILVVGLWLRLTIATDLLVGFLVLAMASLVVLVRRLAASGELDRKEVTRTVKGVFWSVITFGFFNAFQLGISDSHSDLGLGPSMLVLFVGMGALSLLSHGRWWTPAIRFGIALVVGVNVLGVTYSSPWAVRWKLEHLDPTRPPHLNTTFYYRYTVPMMLATRDLTPEGREALVLAHDASWPEPGEHGALRDALFCVGALDALGRGDRVDEKSAFLHGLLAIRWAPPGGTASAGAMP